MKRLSRIISVATAARAIRYFYGIIIAKSCLTIPPIGIGDKKLLNSHGIDTLIDLPGVGENLRKCVLVPPVASRC